MEAGTRVWYNDTTGEEAWILAQVIEKTDAELRLQEVNNLENTFSAPVVSSSTNSDERKYKGVELANDEGRAEDCDDDLTTLPYLNEPAVLHAISQRFFSGKIYTWTGAVLIAVNPFQRLPVYTNVSHETVFYFVSSLLRLLNPGADTILTH